MIRVGKSHRAWVAGAFLLLCGTLGDSQVPIGGDASDASDPSDEAALYDVACPRNAVRADACTVDRRTYLGWQVFHRTCVVCHAADAVGSSFAPNLLPRVRRMDGREFADAMDTGYAGEAEMAPWGRNPEVRPYYLELWTYLSARAGGALPLGEPLPAPLP